MIRFQKGFNEGRERARNKAYRRRNTTPVKLVEPSTGRIVELEVTEQNENVVSMYLNQLKTYAKGLEQFGVQWDIKGKTIQLTFADGNMAENARETWRR